jgi:transcriptional regulator with XRE-family HTH domain
MSGNSNLTVEKIAERIKELRIEGGYTSYRKFADEHDFEPKQYWNIEEGKSNFGIKALIKIVEIHGITMEEFFKGIA